MLPVTAFVWRCSDTPCTSGFIAHKSRLLDVATQLKRSAHATMGYKLCNNASSRPVDAWDYFWVLESNFPGGNT